MGLSTDRIVYGIHSLCPYRRTDYTPYGILKVLGGGSLSMSGEFEDLFGGSNKFAWASEPKTIASEFTATVKSMPDFLFELYLGASVSTVAASATGTVGTIANKKGTSVFKADTGIASVAAKTSDEGDLKTGLYVVIAKSGGTDINLYCLTDIDFASGTDVEYQDDNLVLLAADITIPGTDGTVDVPDYGLEFTGGSGSIALVENDTAFFAVSKAHGGKSIITIGGSNTAFPEHGLYMLAAKRSDGSLFEIEAFKAAAAGFPISLEETVFAIPELTIKLLYDSAQNAVAKLTASAGV